MHAALILAGGKGERIVGYDIPKQYLRVGGKRMISYCLETFEKTPDIDIICVVAQRRWRSHIGDYLFADAGTSRQHSIYNGLQVLRPYTPKYVVIHDAARPCVTLDDIGTLITSAHQFDGATPSLPVTETIYRSFNNKTIANTLNRDELFIGQTPECYDFQKYYAAHEQYADMLASFRGSSEIAVNAGMRISLCTGNPGNFKVTTNEDLERFRDIIEKGGGA